jgi:hypothetical protein
LGVSGEVDFDTFREKPFAAMTAAAAQDGAACLGLHAGAEAELLFARALGRLVCAFHKIGKWRRETRRISQGVNPKSHTPKNSDQRGTISTTRRDFRTGTSPCRHLRSGPWREIFWEAIWSLAATNR